MLYIFYLSFNFCTSHFEGGVSLKKAGVNSGLPVAPSVPDNAWAVLTRARASADTQLKTARAGAAAVTGVQTVPTSAGKPMKQAGAAAVTGVQAATSFAGKPMQLAGAAAVTGVQAVAPCAWKPMKLAGAAPMTGVQAAASCAWVSGGSSVGSGGSSASMAFSAAKLAAGAKGFVGSGGKPARLAVTVCKPVSGTKVCIAADFVAAPAPDLEICSDVPVLGTVASPICVASVGGSAQLVAYVLKPVACPLSVSAKVFIPGAHAVTHSAVKPSGRMNMADEKSGSAAVTGVQEAPPSAVEPVVVAAEAMAVAVVSPPPAGGSVSRTNCNSPYFACAQPPHGLPPHRPALTSTGPGVGPSDPAQASTGE